MDDFDDESVSRLANALDDDPIWNQEGYPYTAKQKAFVRTQAKFLLEERAAGRARQGLLHAKEAKNVLATSTIDLGKRRDQCCPSCP